MSLLNNDDSIPNMDEDPQGEWNSLGVGGVENDDVINCYSSPKKNK